MRKYMLKAGIILSLILITLSIIYVDSISSFMNKLLGILMPFIYGGCIAYILSPLCNIIQKLLDKKHIKKSEFVSIAISEFLILVVVTIAGLIIIPQSIVSLATIIENMPSAIVSTQTWINEQLVKHPWMSDYLGLGIWLDDIEKTIVTLAKSNIQLIANNVVNGATSFGGFIIDLILGICISIFALENRGTFKYNSKKIIEAVFGKKISRLILEEVMIAHRIVGGFIVGKIVDSLIIGVMCFISLKLLNMPYALLVSVIVGITNIIPIAGPFIGAIPGTIIIFSESPIQSIYFIIFILILQQIDGNIIGPKCIGNATNLSTFWVLFAILFFGGLWGIVGMVVGVPILAVVFDIINKVVSLLLNRQALKEIEGGQTET